MRHLRVAACLVFCACARHHELPVYGKVPPFQLTTQTGKAFDSQSLAGHVWVADFIFTNCEGPCPRMSSHMHVLQTATAATPDLKLISFSVDPQRDTPPVLAGYAQTYHADAARWTFLTGDAQVLQNLDREAFKLGNMSGTMDHSTRFVLIDRKGRIRGYYGIAQGDPVPQLAADAKQLESEPG